MRATVPPSALGLGSSVNYSSLLRIEINDIGFVFYVRMSLLRDARISLLSARVSVVGVNWYRRSLSCDAEQLRSHSHSRVSLLPYLFLISRMKEPLKIYEVIAEIWNAHFAYY